MKYCNASIVKSTHATANQHLRFYTRRSRNTRFHISRRALGDTRRDRTHANHRDSPLAQQLVTSSTLHACTRIVLAIAIAHRASRIGYIGYRVHRASHVARHALCASRIAGLAHRIACMKIDIEIRRAARPRFPSLHALL